MSTRKEMIARRTAVLAELVEVGKTHFSGGIGGMNEREHVYMVAAHHQQMELERLGRELRELNTKLGLPPKSEKEVK